MLDISLNNTIQFNHGDSFSAELFLDEGSDCYFVQHKLQDGEYICFAIEEPNQSFEKAIVRKKFYSDSLNQDGNVVITLEPSDTINLLPGLYYYEIKGYFFDVTRELDESGNWRNKTTSVINTVVDKTKFLLL